MKSTFILRQVLACITLTVICSANTLAAIIDIPDNFQTIQAGIDTAAPGDTILPEPGRYAENLHFGGKLVVLASQFIFENDSSIITSTVINGSAQQLPVLTYENEPAGSAVIGVTITGGSGHRIRVNEWQSYLAGGGIYAFGANIQFDNCVITANNVRGPSAIGGGIHAEGGSLRLTNCRFTRNSVDSIFSASLSAKNANIDLQNCLFAENDCGGASISFTNYHPDTVSIMNCQFNGNLNYGLKVTSTRIKLIKANLKIIMDRV